MAASKKWKYTVRVQHDGRPIGTWLEMHGYAPKPMLYATALLSGSSGSVHNMHATHQCQGVMHQAVECTILAVCRRSALLNVIICKMLSRISIPRPKSLVIQSKAVHDCSRHFMLTACHVHRRERPATADCKMATRDRNKTRSSDVSGEQSQGTTGQLRASALQRTQSIGRSALATAPSAALATAPAAALMAAPSATLAAAVGAAPEAVAAPAVSGPQTQCTIAPHLLAAAAAAVNRAAALQEAQTEAQGDAAQTAATWADDAMDAMDVDTQHRGKVHGHAQADRALKVEATSCGQGSKRHKRKVCHMLRGGLVELAVWCAV